MSARRILGVLGAAGLIALIALLNKDDSESGSPQVLQGKGDSVIVPSEPGAGTQAETNDLQAVVAPGPARDTLTEGRVVIALSEGGPASSSVFSWSPVVPLLLSSTWDWDEVDLSWWTRETTMTTADVRGEVDPDVPDLAAGLGSLVWIDLPGCEALFDVLTPDMTTLGGRSFELLKGPAVTVHVLDNFGEPAQNVIVEQHGVALRSGIDAPPYVPLLFHRVHTTDRNGTCTISRFPGMQAVVAHSTNDVSRPVILDEQTEKVVLRLSDSFTISGTVSRPTSQELVGEIIPRLTVSAREDNVWRELGTAVAREDEAWGPLTLPCEAGSDYRVEVHGIGVIPSETFFPAPAPKEHITLHLEAHAGLGQWFVAYDEERRPLPDARVTVTWEENGMRRGVWADARPDGFISVLGIRPGFVKAFASCPGRTSVAFPPQNLPLSVPTTLSVILARGTTMSGRVVRNGVPVPDFEITYWPSDDLDLRRSKMFLDQEDGAFLIDDAYIEPMGIVAAAPGSPGSRPMQVEVAEGGVQGLELVLVDALPGSGVVVEKGTGEPLSDASVQPYVLGGGGPVSPWGPPVSVQPDGRFSLQAFREGENWLLVTAPGYGARQVYAKSEASYIDFGVIPLEQSVDLRVEIWGGASTGTYHLQARGIIPLGTSLFEPDNSGALVGWLRSVGVGFHEFRLYCPGGAEAHLSLDVTAQTKVLRFPGGNGSLLVGLQGRPKVAGVPSLYVEQEVEDVRMFQRIVPFEPGGQATLPGLRPGPARLYVRVLDNTLASTTATILDGEPTLVTINLAASDLLLRAIDIDKDPVTGATVRLFGTEAVKESHGGLTDEEGELLLRGLNRGRYLLHVNHPSLGLLPDEEILIGEDEHVEREVVLDGRASLELLLVDGDVPLPGLTCRLLDRAGRNLSSSVLSNEEGRAAIPRLAPGAYRLSVTGGAIWKIDAAIDVQAGAGLRTMEVRRLGDLRMRVLNAEGVPVHGVEVSLVFGPTGEVLQDWIAAGRIGAPGGLETDKHGEILLSGLPHGPYSWRCGAAEGGLEVAPAKESLVLISL